MAGGIQPVQSNPRSDYGGGNVVILDKLNKDNDSKKRGSKSGGGSSGSSAAAGAASESAGSFKRGGKVRKTGLAKVHKGERVLTAKQDNKRKSKGRRKGRSKSR